MKRIQDQDEKEELPYGNCTGSLSGLNHQALGGNSSGMCRCPAHDDNNPSLHVSEGANGKVLVKCHAGCSQEAVINTLKRLRTMASKR